jgi:adenosine deaminase
VPVARRSVAALPKAHVHNHLIPSARRATIEELADRAGVDLSAAWTFGNLAEFVAKTLLAFQVVRTPDDLARICREFVEDEAAEGVRYTEPMIGVGYFAKKFGLAWEETFAIQHDAIREASARTGVAVGYMFGILRHQSAREAEEIARFAAAHADRGVVALGIAGDEALGSFATFRWACEIAREAGLLVVPHAGEAAGPESVRDALDVLRPHRIAHGVRAVEDPEVLRRLADEGIPCDVCPTSNVKLGVVRDIEAHQLPAMIEAGVRVTINADDQLYFGPKVSEEYALVRDAFGLSDEALAEIARTSARVSGAPAEVRARLLAEIDAWLAAPPTS